MDAINDGLKNVAKAREFIKSYLDSEEIDDDLLKRALELLEKSIDILSKSVQ